MQAKADLLDALRREAERLKAEADEIFQLYLAKEITARTLGERHQPIEDRRVELEAEIPRLQGEIDFLRIQHLSREEVVSEAEDLYDRWEDLAPEDRRAIVQAIVERVTVGTDEIEITLSCLPRRPEPSHPPPLKMATTYAHIPALAAISAIRATPARGSLQESGGHLAGIFRILGYNRAPAYLRSASTQEVHDGLAV